MKQFAGFTPSQQYALLSKLGYQGPAQEDDMDKFMLANPAVAIRMGKYAEMAQSKLNEPKKFYTGGSYFDYVKETGKTTLEGYKSYLDYLTQQASNATPNNSTTTTTNTTTSTDTDTGTSDGLSAMGTTSNALVEKAIESPEDLASKAEVAQTDENTGQIDSSTGQVTNTTPQAETTTVDMSKAQQAEAPEYFDPATFDPTLISDDLKTQLNDIEAAQADPSKEATVQGQLESLMQDFEEGTPPWAAGAMRQAMGVMQSRGLGASSMAGQAVLQAAMEAALPIASQDAQTYATFELQNLNNRQQVVMFKAQQQIAGMFSDQAAENAAKQFNATSENQTKQFFASLQESVSRFNAAQVNGLLQFNAGQANQIEMFNTQLEEAREQFNAQNAVVIAQANARLRADIATANTAAQNAANMQYAQSMTGLTAAAMDQVWQKERDLMTMAFQAAENQLDRDAEIAMSKLTAKQKQDYADQVGKGQVVGTIVGSLANNLFDSIF